MKRKCKSVRNFPGIYKVLVSINGSAWNEPERGGRYAVARYEQTLQGRRRTKRHFDSFEEAKAFKEGKPLSEDPIAQPLTSTQASSANNSMRLKDLFEVYARNELIHKSVTTRDKYKSYCKFLAPLWEIPVAEINVFAIDSWLAWLKSPEQLAQHCSRRCNFEHEYTFLRTLLGYYHETFDHEYRMPFLRRHRDNLKIKEVALVQKDLSPAQVKSFLAELKKEEDKFYYYLAGMQYFTFSRLQDAVALHHEDFDFVANAVTLSKKIVFRRIKGCSRELVQGSKTNQGKRIGMSPPLVTLFKEWTMLTGIRKGPLFLLKDGTWPTYRSIQHAYDKAFKAAGIPFSGTHILRHASLSEAQETSGDIKVTQTLAGHKSIATTERYAKARAGRLQEIQTKVGQKIFTADGSQ
ncbi:tyrosine-type recombinase/integrase [Bdellovibrio sp. HCB337]|uniref:tyrosine-type recombinase/integrase n=1 Tax=Bdellovibrio sp. HCB337 TaxID=3394358 RepID=UPI0039A62CA3